MTAQQSTIKELVISSAARIENRRSQNQRTLNKNKAMKVVVIYNKNITFAPL